MNRVDEYDVTERVELLAQCPGMDAAKAAELLRLLPKLGLVSSSVAIALAGLEAPGSDNYGAHKQRNAFYIQRLLAGVVPAILADKEGRLAYFLRHLMEKPGADRVRACMAAVLRSYSDVLRHPSSLSAYSCPCPESDAEGDDGDLLAAEDTGES